MNRYRKLTSNIAFMTIGQFSSRLLGLLLIPLYTSVLSTSEFGSFDLLTTTVSLTTPVFTLIIYEAVLRFCLDKQNDPRKILSIGLYITLLGTLLACMVYPLTFLLPVLKQYYLWYLVFFLTSNLQTLLTQYLKGIEKVKLFTLCGVIGTAVSLILNIVFLLKLRWGITGYMLAYIISHIVVCLIVVLRCRLWRELVRPKKCGKENLKGMLRYSIPMIPNSICWWISNSSDKYMLAAIIGAAATGVYSVAYKIPSLLAVVSTIFMAAWQISAVEDFGSEESRKMFSTVYRLVTALNIAVAAALVAVSKLLAGILYQKEFFEAWQCSNILITANVFQALSAMLGSIYTSAKKTKMLFYSTIIAAALNILINIFLIPVLGMLGAAIATMLSYMAVWLIRLINSRRILKLDIDLFRDIVAFLLLAGETALMLADLSWSLYGAIGLALLVALVYFRPLYTSHVFAKLFGQDRKKTSELPSAGSNRDNRITPEFEYLLYLASCGATGSSPAAPCKRLEWVKLYNYAKEQSIWPLTAAVLEKAPWAKEQVPAQLLQNWTTTARDAAITAYIHNTHTLRVIRMLHENEIESVLLKGFSVGRCYAMSDYRISSDADLLINPSDEAKAVKLMEKNGYIIEHRSPTSHHSVCYQKGAGTIELHISLYGEIVEDVWFKEIDAKTLFKEPCTTVSTVDGSYRALGTTDCLIFVMLHALKHFIANGMSIRMLLDIGQLFRTSATCADMKRFWQVMDTINCRTAVDAILTVLCRYGDYQREDFPGMRTAEPEQVRLLLEDLQTGGCMGEKMDNVGEESWRVYNYYRSAGMGKPGSYRKAMLRWSIRNLFYQLFLPRKVLVKQYPVLKKAGILLPFIWLYRVFFRAPKMLLQGRVKTYTVDKHTEVSPQAKIRVDMFRKMELFRRKNHV